MKRRVRKNSFKFKFSKILEEVYMDYRIVTENDYKGLAMAMRILRNHGMRIGAKIEQLEE